MLYKETRKEIAKVVARLRKEQKIDTACAVGVLESIGHRLKEQATSIDDFAQGLAIGKISCLWCVGTITNEEETRIADAFFRKR